MTREVVLSKCLGQHIGDLVRGSNREDLDQSFTDMLSKVMVSYVDVLGARAKLWKPCKFKST
jgi:hypothetical protein